MRWLERLARSENPTLNVAAQMAAAHQAAGRKDCTTALAVLDADGIAEAQRRATLSLPEPSS